MSGNENQVKTKLLRLLECILLRKDSDLQSLGVNDTKLGSLYTEICRVVLARSALKVSSRYDSQCQKLIFE